jgi:hypothetical protein
MLQIIVHRKDNAVLCRSDAAKKRVVLPVIPTHAEPPHPLVRACKLSNDWPGTIAACIFNEDDLKIRRHLRHRIGKLAVQIEQRLLGTIDRNYNGNRKQERMALFSYAMKNARINSDELR